MQKKFHTHFSFLNVLLYMGITSFFLIIIYKIISISILKGNLESYILQIVIVLIVLLLTALRFIRSDIIIDQKMLVLNKGIYKVKYPIEKVSEIKTLISLNGRSFEDLTLILLFHENKGSLILSLEDPFSFLEEIIKINQNIEIEEELKNLIKK
ncbi:hypothetical protein J5Y03_12145 [Bacillus sp. RG28]|uniref:Uncharacterized protein n=1 Tax=Gottfriedia endophytica TaxID=2820819 RepID=A0A940NKL0_9BACI|nr:hypothetical protein [Gottfriedia endophytica]MBP0725922.1 hypothetical protein [Gottfriedia endophytica]